MKIYKKSKMGEFCEVIFGAIGILLLWLIGFGICLLVIFAIIKWAWGVVFGGSM